MKINPNDPLVRSTRTEYNGLSTSPTVAEYGGLSIRAELAARFMSAILVRDPKTYNMPAEVAHDAVIFADALIAQLNKD